MMTPNLYHQGYHYLFTSPPVPLSLRRGGNKYSWGTPPDPRQREIPLDSLYYCLGSIKQAFREMLKQVQHDNRGFVTPIGMTMWLRLAMV